MMSQIILGVDPGLTRCGYGIISQNGNCSKVLSMGVITTDKKDPNPTRLAQIYEAFKELIEAFEPQAMAVERVFIERNLKTGTGVTQAAGIVLALGSMYNCEIREYTPTQIKKTLTNDGTADKKQVQKMVGMLLGINEVIKPVDISDALAVALCHLAQAPQLEYS